MTTTAPPLTGVTVIDLSHVYNGPYATFLLAMAGAHVDVYKRQGVSRTQALATGYRPYKASAGIKSVGFGISAAWLITPHWIVNMSSAVNRLVGSAGESPITEVKNQAVVSLSAIYKF